MLKVALLGDTENIGKLLPVVKNPVGVEDSLGNVIPTQIQVDQSPYDDTQLQFSPKLPGVRSATLKFIADLPGTYCGDVYDATGKCVATIPIQIECAPEKAVVGEPVDIVLSVASLGEKLENSRWWCW